MTPWLLHLDDSLPRQPRLQEAVRRRDGGVVEARDLGPELRLWCAGRTLGALSRRLEETMAAGEPKLIFAGSGDFHHLTPVFLARALGASDDEVTVVHFDNHPDWMRALPGRHCGSWVGTAARMKGVSRVITIGCCSPDIGGSRQRQGDTRLVDEGRLTLFAWSAPRGGEGLKIRGRPVECVAAIGEAAFIDQLQAEISTPAVYLTVDKDVLRPADAVTNWDQGEASLDFVLSAARAAVCGRQLIGADVVGDWSEPRWGGNMLMRGLKAGESWLDKPRSLPDRAGADRINEAANLRLLETFAS